MIMDWDQDEELLSVEIRVSMIDNMITKIDSITSELEGELGLELINK